MNKKKTYSNYEIDRLQNDLNILWGIPMKLLVGNAPCFSQKEFEKHYGKIMVLSGNRRNIEDCLNSLK